MKDSKAATIIGYILIGIVLIPIAAVALYVILGLALYLTLFIIDRVKNGREEVNKGKPYKLASTVIFLICLAGYAFIAKDNIAILSWQTWLILNGIVFVGMLPLVLYQYLKLKHKI